MKSFKISFLLIGITLIGLASCSKDDSNSDDDPNLDNECEITTIASAEAATNFSDANDDNYTNLCNDYKAALEAQIDACGDPNGNIQSIIDDLGDCSQDPEQNVQGELSVTVGTLPVDFEIISIVLENGLIKVNGEDTSSSSHKMYFEVSEDVTGEDAIQNFQIELNGTIYYPYNEGSQFDFTSEIETNSDGVLVGSFFNVVTSNEGADISLSNGSIDLEY
ncbi:hypothetical protein [Mesonia sp. K4-1]|uniref:hypothetical protein n=1 Tax=Mesonia sp. K4-1 TaxID=2602760 RepID=UPI0011C70355|nr:hypothetical protein [Mesonia sp. K4-1]TXK74891.1 hypothetical protein FT986_10310 [Mesonia sp. K4-1]